MCYILTNVLEEPSVTPAVAYLRVSTDKQVDHGVSLDAQREKLVAYATLYDLELVAIEVDAGVSAKTLERPALQSALKRLEKGEARVLVVMKLDRLTRSVGDLGVLVEKYFAKGKWELMSVSENINTQSAAGRLVLNVLGSVSQWEREAIGERTSVAMQHKASRGEYTGGEVPFGYRLGSDGVAIEAYQPEQAILERVRALRGAGMSLRRIGQELVAQGLTNRSGASWGPSTLKRVLDRQAA